MRSPIAVPASRRIEELQRGGRTWCRPSRDGFVRVVDPDRAISMLQEEAFLDLIPSTRPCPAGVQRLGVLASASDFGFVPLLAIGGKEEAANLDRGRLWEHIAVITRFAGHPAPRRR